MGIVDPTTAGLRGVASLTAISPEGDFNEPTLRLLTRLEMVEVAYYRCAE
jgi:hypothetical protein